MRTGLQKELVRRFGRDMNDVAGREFLARSAIDGRAAQFVGRSGFRVQHFPAEHESRAAGLDHEQIRFGFVKLGFAAAASIGDEGVMIAEVAQPVVGEVVSRFGRERFRKAFQFLSAPVAEADGFTGDQREYPEQKRQFDFHDRCSMGLSVELPLMIIALRAGAGGGCLKLGNQAGTISSWRQGIERASMNVSVKGDYALHAIFDLALQKPGEPIKIADIARRQKIPQKFLELILAGLKQGGFVESRRGAEGGYLLARAPDAITVGEVIRFVEGAKTNRAVRKQPNADPFSETWRRVDSAVSEVIDRTTFAELARNWRDRQAKYVPNWEI